MCYMCEENNGEMESCQECGIMICFDVEVEDDVIAPAGVTASGDLFCRRHAAQYDREEEEQDDEYMGWNPGPWDW